MSPFRLSVLALLVFAHLAYASGPHVGPELELTSLDDMPVFGDQSAPSIASRGEEALAVWKDSRSVTLLAARIGADGKVLDRHGISLNYNVVYRPQAVWNGSDYLVLAQTQLSMTAMPTWIHRVSAAGRFLSRVNVGQFFEARLFGGPHGALLVAPTKTDSLIATLNSDGSIRKKLTLPAPVIAGVADGEDWILFGTRCNPTCNGRFYQFRIRDGVLINDREIFTPLSPIPSRATAATDGNGRFLLFWSETATTTIDNSARQDAVAGPFRYLVTDRDGKVIAAPRVVDQIDAKFFTRDDAMQYFAPSLERPDATWFNNRFVLTWNWLGSDGRNEVRAISIDAGGNPIEDTPRVVDSITEPIVWPGKRPVVAATHTKLHLLWPNTSPSRTWLNLRTVSSLDELSMPFDGADVLRSATAQGAIETASSNDATLVVWTEGGGFDGIVRGRIVRNDGSESPVIEVSQSDRMAELVAAAYGSGMWLVAWREKEYPFESTGDRELHAYHVLARRFDRNGNALDPEPIVLAVEPSLPGSSWFGPWKMTVAASSGQFFVAWRSTLSNAIHAMRVGTDGRIAGTEPMYISSGNDASRGAPHALWTGRDYFLLFHDQMRVASGERYHLARSTRVTTTGETGAFPELASTSVGWDIYPSPFEAATNGTEVLVTWSERRYSLRGCIYAQRFDFDGNPLGKREELQCATGENALPSRTFAVWDGTQFRVIYSHQSSVWAHTLGGERVKLFDTTGSPALGRPVATPAGIILPYTRVPLYASVTRVFRRTINFDPPRRRAVR